LMVEIILYPLMFNIGVNQLERQYLYGKASFMTSIS